MLVKGRGGFSPTIERAFINDEIGKNLTKSQELHRKLIALWSKVKCFLSYFDWIRFCRCLAGIDQRKQNQIEAKHFKNLNWLQKQRFSLVSSNFAATLTICLITNCQTLNNLF